MALQDQDPIKARPLLEECAELHLLLANLYGQQPKVQTELAQIQAKLAEITEVAS